MEKKEIADILLLCKNSCCEYIKNAMHLRNLITELLDFRKQEQGFLKLKVVQKDVVEFVKEIYLSF